MKTPKLAIAIPARYGSTRFPGKPLALIAGKTMLSRVVDIARRSAESFEDVIVFVATDDKRIAEHAQQLDVTCIHTPSSSPTGSDRVLSALRQFSEWPDFIINLQGDAPFTPPAVLMSIFEAYVADRTLEVITPVQRLSWSDLDVLRQTKSTSPFSGTTVVINERNQALWFSKTILPCIRNESALRAEESLSPVHQHMGLYGFRTDILEKFCRLPEGRYERLEGLEQLRLLENGIRIQAILADLPDGKIRSGIDSPEDLARAEAYIRKFGEPVT